MNNFMDVERYGTHNYCDRISRAGKKKKKTILLYEFEIRGTYIYIY